MRYEIDLSQEHAHQLADAISPYPQAARRVSRPGRPIFGMRRPAVVVGLPPCRFRILVAWRSVQPALARIEITRLARRNGSSLVVE